MATTIHVSLEDLYQLRERIDRKEISGDDWVMFDALVGRLIARGEAQQARLKAKAEHEAQEMARRSEAEPVPDIGKSNDGESNDHGGEGRDGSDSAGESGESRPNEAQPEGAPEPEGPADADDPGPKGHGRHGADAFTNVTKVVHTLAAGIIGGLCEACGKGRVSRYRDKVVIRIIGQPIFGAERHHFEQGRCRLCGAIVRAAGMCELVLAGIGTSYVVYDWSTCAMLIVMHYFAGAPFKRLEGLHQGWGVPMPDANQWRIVDESDDRLAPLYRALERHGIKRATTLRFDDTGSMVIDIQRAIQQEIEALVLMGESTTHVRTGINATCVYLETEEGKVVLFFTGRHHAGEVIDRLLEHRRASRKKLVCVTDAASKNFSHSHTDKLEEAVCNAHCYLKFRAVKDKFPAEHALAGEVYKKVFDNDDKAKALELDADARMLYHKTHSEPEMLRLLSMCKEKVDARLVEPNSPLWEPVSFVINQWERLTKFCRVPGVPLDTNVVEQTLIIPVRYLAGSFAYKTQNGADVGDRHMSLVATANANGVEPVAYLTECLRNHEDLKARPDHYLPWVYRERCAKPDRGPPAEVPPAPNPSPTREVRHPLRPGVHPANAPLPAQAGRGTRPADPEAESAPVRPYAATFRQSSGNAQLDGSPPQMST